MKNKPVILGADGKQANKPEPEPVKETVKPCKIAFKYAFDNGLAQPLNNASTCTRCSRNTYFPKGSQICYDCLYDLNFKEKIGRNAPCPCGSGNKWKKCCGNNKIQPISEL